MIKHLRIQNFKGWEDTGNITLAPLTVFLGENSSGKSSIGQFLMMLKQSVESSDSNTVFFTGDGSTAVNLGTSTDIVFEHNIDKEISFNYDWSSNEKITLGNSKQKDVCQSEHVTFEGKVGISGTKNSALEVQEFSYSFDVLEDKNKKIEIGLKKKETEKKQRGYELTHGNIDLTRSRGRAWSINSPVKFYGFPDEAVAYYQNSDFLRDINVYHERLFKNIYYLGPLRTPTNRFYTWNGNTPESVGYLGQDAIQAILSADSENRMINLKPHSRRKNFQLIIAEMLKKMGLIDEFNIEQISDSQYTYDVKVKTKGSKDWVSIPDVGIGVSQVLPVIVELFYAPPGSIIIMEQPELHLHPSAQAGLADVVIAALHARENYKNRDIQLLIETHSEHFLRRLLRRVAEEDLELEEFSAYFANIDHYPATLEKLKVDTYGNIDNWPKNFFGDIAGDIFAQTNVALERRINRRNE